MIKNKDVSISLAVGLGTLFMCLYGSLLSLPLGMIVLQIIAVPFFYAYGRGIMCGRLALAFFFLPSLLFGGGQKILVFLFLVLSFGLPVAVYAEYFWVKKKNRAFSEERFDVFAASLFLVMTLVTLILPFYSKEWGTLQSFIEGYGVDLSKSKGVFMMLGEAFFQQSMTHFLVSATGAYIFYLLQLLGVGHFVMAFFSTKNTWQNPMKLGSWWYALAMFSLVFGLLGGHDSVFSRFCLNIILVFLGLFLIKGLRLVDKFGEESFKNTPTRVFFMGFVALFIVYSGTKAIGVVIVSLIGFVLEIFGTFKHHKGE